MPRIAFTQNLQRHLHCPPLTVTGTTLGEALQQLFQANPGIKGYLYTDQGRFRQHIMVAIDGEILLNKNDVQFPLQQHSEIYISQALSGG